MAGCIRQYLRLKPSHHTKQDSSFFKLNSETEFQLLVPPNNREPYQFSQIFSPPSDDCCPILGQFCAESLINSINCSVIAIGGEHSGKTYTIFGDSSSKNLKKSLTYNTVASLFEKLKSTPKDKSCSVTVTFVEILNEKVRDLGLAYFKRTEMRLNQISEFIDLQDLPIKETAGKSYVEDACIIQVINSAEAADILSMGLKVKEYLKTNGDCIFCINLSQRFKNEIHSAKLYLVDFNSSASLDFLDDTPMNHFQKVLNKINLTNLGVPVKSIPFKGNKITYLLQGSLVNSNVLVIANIDTDPGKFKETYEVLNFMKLMVEIDKKIKMRMLTNPTSSKSKEWARRLQDEIKDLDSNIKKSQTLFEEKLRNFGKLIGIDEDLELLVVAEKGTREFEICRKYREAVQTVNNLVKRNEVLEKKLEKFKKELNELQILHISNLNKNKNYLHEIHTELKDTKDKLDEYDNNKDANFSEKMRSGTEGLEKQLLSSHYNLEETSVFLNTLKSHIDGNTTDIKNLLEARYIIKSEVETDYKRQIIDNDLFHKQQLLSLEQNFKSKYSLKYKMIFEESHDYAQKIRELDQKFLDFQQEAANLFEVARLQGKAIYDIENGMFNKGISPVLIPRTHIPLVPTNFRFPLIFAALGSHSLELARKSSKVKSQFSYKKVKNQSTASFERSVFKENDVPVISIEESIDSLLNTRLENLNLAGLRNTGTNLQRIIKTNAEKVIETTKHTREINEAFNMKKNELEKEKFEVSKYKELYQEILNKRIEDIGRNSQPVFKAFLTEVSRPGTQRNIDTNTKMLRNVYTSVSGHRLPYPQAVKMSQPSSRPLTTMTGGRKAYNL